MKQKILMLITLLLLGVGTALGQTITAKGRVVDENNEGVPTATVRLKSDAKKGTFTDMNGNFVLEAKQGEIILISFVGYKDMEVAAQASMGTIKLVPDQEVLEEVVVVGYMTRKIASTSASIVKVSSKDLEQKPTANPMDALQGKVSGLQIYTSSGEPSQASSMRLHGTGSLTAGSAPLYIMDGMPVSSATVMSANPNDFESVQVLKDAAATSIYGARAANGVVYITTKKGTADERANITFRGQYGISQLANPSYYKNMLNTEQYLQMVKEYGVMSDEAIDNIREKYGKNNTEWWKYYLRQNVPTYQADVAISGGGGRTNYYVSGGMFSQEGMREGSNYKKLNLRSNLSSQLNKYIKMGLNMGLNYDLANTSPFAANSTGGGGLATLAPPYYSPIDPETGKNYEDIIAGWGRVTPKHFTTHQKSNEKTVHVNTSGNIQIKPIEGLTLRSQAGLELRDFFYDRYRLASHINSEKDGGFATKEFDRVRTWTFTNTAMYQFDINDIHNFSALLGHEYIDYSYHMIWANSSGQRDARLPLLPQGPNKDVDESIAEYAFLSYFGQLSYDYMNKYFVDLVLRNDASSRFGANKRNGTFWSVGLMWKAKQEEFLKNVKWVDALDVKFSIGTQGNAEIGNYDHLALVGKNGQYNSGIGWGVTSPGNPDLGWENQRKITFGFDARLFNRLNFNLEYYHRLTYDMLMAVPKPLSTGLPQDELGFASVMSNISKYLNQGIDLHIDYDIIKKKDASLNIYTNLNYNIDKVIELFQGRDSWILPGYGFGYIVGQPVTFVYPIFKQINPANGYPEWYLPSDNVAETTKNEVTSEFNDTLEQNTGVRRYTPFTGGFGLSGGYKGFYAQADFSFALGKHMISNDKFFFENPYIFPKMNQSTSVLNYWKQKGDNVLLPGLDYLHNVSDVSTEFDSRMIENASFMRLKNLTFGYAVPTRYLASQNVLKGAKVYFAGRNLLTFTKFKGPDPEVDSNLSFGAYPNSKQFIFGVELNF